jgi:hypothetical protein
MVQNKLPLASIPISQPSPALSLSIIVAKDTAEDSARIPNTIAKSPASGSIAVLSVTVNVLFPAANLSEDLRRKLNPFVDTPPVRMNPVMYQLRLGPGELASFVKAAELALR